MMDDLFEEFNEMDNAFASLDDNGEEHEQKIHAFNEQVERNIKILLSKKPSEDKRIAAAYWLGESGAPKAIYALRKIYRGEKNRRVKSAATYALGQFKALDNAIVRGRGESVGSALQNEENAEIMQLLTAITIEGRTGKRKPISPQTLMKVEIGLAVLLIILVMLNVVLPSGDGTGRTENDRSDIALAPNETVAVSTLRTLQSSATMLRVVAASLQTQYGTEPVTTDCAQTLAMPAPMTIPGQVDAAYPHISLLVNRLNQQITTLQPDVDLHSQICSEGRQPTAEEIMQITANAGTILTELDSITTSATVEDSNIIATAEFRAENPPTALPTEPGPTATETETPTATPTETATPTPTINPQVINQDITNILFIIDNVNNRQGGYTLLNTFWTDVQTVGQTGGCRERVPDIPEDYPEISAELLEIAPDLGQAREQVNIGLGLLRQGWIVFTESCANGTLAQNLQTGLQIVTTANSAFTNANMLLTTLRQR